MPRFTLSDRDEQPFRSLIETCHRADTTLGIAESLTGGLLGYLLIRQEGGGAVVTGSLVTYHSQVKRRLLRVGPGPVVSGAAAGEMAVGARRLLNVEWAVSLTGVAGPETQDGMPVGTLFVGLADRSRTPRVLSFHLQGEPDEIRWAAAVQAAEVANDAISVRGAP